MRKLISIIAPMYNEEETCCQYTETTLLALESLKDHYDYEIIFVHDGAKDHTLLKMQDMQRKYPDYCGIVNLSRNFGLEGAVHAGLTVAKGDAVVVMDADLQDPPSLIPEMIKKWEAGADIVIASRVARSSDTFVKKFTAHIYYKVLDSLSGKLKLEKNAANFRLLSRKALKQLLNLPEVNTYFRVNVPFIGMKTAKVEYDRNERFAGTTNYDFYKLVRCALDGLTSISIEPLRKVMYMIPIMLIFFLASLVAVFFVEERFLNMLLVIAFVSFLFTILFMCLSVMAEYMAQIMIEVRHRPTSIIYDYKPSLNAEKR